MLESQAIIDTSVDPLVRAAGRRRTLRRVGIPIAAVILTIVVIVAIALQANEANRAGALTLSNDVLKETTARIDEEVTNYFGTATRTLAVGESMADREPPGEPRRTLIEKYALSAVKYVGHITAFDVANANGDYMMIWQNDASGGYDTKLIQNGAGSARSVLWVRRNAAGDVIGQQNDPSDTYDPRTRPWYTGALKTNGVYWSDVYKFHTGNAPGITVAKRYETAEGQEFVVGIDLTLESLSRFLADLKIGKTGRALIIDGSGKIIAHPQMQSALETVNGDVTTKHVDEIGDAPAAGAYDHFRVNGPGRATVTVDGVRYLATLTPLKDVGHNWSTMIVLPEDDLVGFVGKANRTSLLISLVIVGLAVVMAGLLIRQGLRTDRVARLLRQRSAAMARQREALDLIADEVDLYDPLHPELPQSLTEAAAEITGARRASIWYLQSRRSVLHCADSFDSETARHSAGFELHRDELPRFFDSVVEGGALDVPDAASDPRTTEIHRLLMAPLGGRSLSITPMRRRGHAVGAVWLEDAPGAGAARDFLRLLAGTAAQRAAETAPEPTPEASDLDERPIEPEIARCLSPDLTLSGFDRQQLGDNLYPQVAVLVIRIDESAATGNGGVSPPELIDSVVCAMQEIAAEQDIPYLKLVGYDIVGAAGFSPDDPTSAARIANTAIAGRERLMEIFEATGRAPDFRLGIDCGAAIGGVIGAGPRLFNLWGSATQTARVMAETALPGSIQISEAAYGQLRRNFLLRPRGTFFQAGIGTAQTFVLAGRL